MNQLTLRVYDGIALTGLLMLPVLFSTGLSTLVKQNSTAGWITLLLAFGVMLCLFLGAARLMEGHKGQHIIQITSAVAGRPAGFLCGAGLGGYFCFFTGIHLRESAEILKIYGLNLTPLWVVVGLLFCAAVMMNLLGARAIIKSAGFFFIIIGLGIGFVLLLGLNRYNPDNLFPVLGSGVPHLVKNGLFTASIFDSVIILFLFAPAFSSWGSMVRSGVFALGFAAGASVLLCACYTMMFSPQIAATMMSGFMEMGKSSYYNHFFYRFESFLLFFLIFSSVLQASIGLLAARESLACACGLKPSRILTVLCAIPVLAVVVLPANVLDLTQVYLPVIRQYSVFFLAGLPLLIGSIRAIKRTFGYETH